MITLAWLLLIHSWAVPMEDLSCLPPEKGRQMYFKLFAITEDGKRMVVLPTGADGVMKPSAPGMVLHVGDETVIQLRNPGEGANLAATPQDLRAWHFQGRELSFIATWTDSKEPPVQPLVPDHLLVIKGELAEAK